MKDELPTPQYEYYFVNSIFNVPGLPHSTPAYHPHGIKASVGRALRTYYHKVTFVYFSARKNAHKIWSKHLKFENSQAVLIEPTVTRMNTDQTLK